jgi:hypothetical protein
MSRLKTVGFLQLTAELLIGAEDRVFIVHLAPKHHCSMSLSANPPVCSTQSTRAWESRPRAFHPPTQAILSTAPYHIRQRHPPTTSEPLIPAHLDRECNRRWAELCGSVKQKGAFAWFMVPRWNASAHLCRARRDRVSLDEWSPTKASGSARTSS